MIDAEDVDRAAARLAGIARRTPVITSHHLDQITGATVFLKAESFQRTGSFKFRGAYNAVAASSSEQRRRGIAAYSSGNHAQAVACAAALLGTSAVVVMPHDAPASKVAATSGYGARIVAYDRYRESREEVTAALVDAEGRVLIPPYDHHDVMAGQGTAVAELLDDVAGIDTLLVCLGGGGLLAGSCVAAHARDPSIEIYGVEPEAGDDHARSRVAGRRVDIAVPETIADGQQTTSPGALTWPITNAHVTEFVTVTDNDILATMGLLFERLKLVVEPSGASALAALVAGKLDFRGRRIGVTLSGGNIDVARFASLVGGRGTGPPEGVPS